MKVVFMGTPDFSVPALDAVIAAGHEVVAVYTQPPRPAGRGKRDRPSPVQARAEARGLEVRHPVSLRTAEAVLPGTPNRRVSPSVASATMKLSSPRQRS